jgi:hypothetical protein
MVLKAVHIPRKLNMTTDKLSRLEINENYSLPRKTFQFIQETLDVIQQWTCCFKKEPIIKEICISDTNKGSGQCHE